MDIAGFIEARLREDEGQARAAAEEFGPDWIEIWSGTVALDGNVAGRVPEGRSGWDAHLDTADSGISRHIVDWDPTRVLREIAAKRALLRLWQEMDGSDAYEAGSWAQILVNQLLAPYGKRAVFTRSGSSGPLSWQLEDLPEAADKGA